MKNCPDELKIQSYVDGELSATEAAAVERHLQSCEHCRHIARRLEMTHAALSGVESITAPLNLLGTIENAVQTRGEGIDCETARELISASLDGELVTSQADALSAHLEECADCRYFAERLGVLVDVLQSVEPVAPPAGLRQRIEKAVAAVTEDASVIGHIRRRWRGGVAVAATVAAAAAIILAVVFHGGQPGPSNQPQYAPPAHNQIVDAPERNAESTTDEPAADARQTDRDAADEPDERVAHERSTEPAPEEAATDTESQPRSAPSERVARAPGAESPAPAPAVDVTEAEAPPAPERDREAEPEETEATDSAATEPMVAEADEVPVARRSEVPPLIGARPVRVDNRSVRNIGEKVARDSEALTKRDIEKKPVNVAMVMASRPADLPHSTETRLDKTRPEESGAIETAAGDVSRVNVSHTSSSGSSNWLPHNEDDKFIYRGSNTTSDRLAESSRRIRSSIENLRDREPKALVVID